MLIELWPELVRQLSKAVRAGGGRRLIAVACLEDIEEWLQPEWKRKDDNGAEVETGGLLFGERDDAASAICVNEVSGPP